MSDQALTVVSGGRALDSPRSVEELRARRDLMRAFIRDALVTGRDYGVIPGTGKKPALLQPGAEKLCTLFRFSTQTRVVEKVEDFTGDGHGGEPFFMYVATCVVSQGGLPVATREASCNSWEAKYRWREQKPRCPACGAEAVNRSRDKEGEYYCWRKVGGCGAVYRAGSPQALAIGAMPAGRVVNSEICDQLNTLSQMAQKRAMISAVKAACDASEYFTTPDAPGAPGAPGAPSAPSEQSAAAPAATQEPQDAPAAQSAAAAVSAPTDGDEGEDDPFAYRGFGFASDVLKQFGLGAFTKEDYPWLIFLNDGKPLETVEGKRQPTPAQWERCFAGMAAVAACIRSDKDRAAAKRPENWVGVCVKVCGRQPAGLRDITQAEWCSIAAWLYEQSPDPE
jgi:hypothetical protein